MELIALIGFGESPRTRIPSWVPNAIDASVNSTPANIATIFSAVPNVTQLLVGSGGATNGSQIFAPLAGITGTGDVITGEGNSARGTLNKITEGVNFTVIGIGAADVGIVNQLGGQP